MKKYFVIILCAGIAVVAISTGVFAGDRDAKERRHADFERRLEALGDSSLRSFFGGGMPAEQREALEFLYAYMPLADVANKSPEYYAENVAAAYRARAEMPWGDSVPEREFRHFVVPTRINNEYLDDSRTAFYEELRDRVKGLSMRDAILEVNHWCHEKVTYQPSDARTSSPLSSVSQAIGRCGEESTFAVAALRSVGIPARQVYTPRWAHTDDNHAWVEAWADGRWWFLGACEPEPILNLAWFNAPASRGMLMNTKVYGDYDGPEEQLGSNNVATTINVTSNYAEVNPVKVAVKDVHGKAVANAIVDFCLYNYAEYYPIATKVADKDGNAELKCGNGDLVVWATDGVNFGMGIANAKMDQPVTISIDKDGAFEGVVEFNTTPPPTSAKLPAPTPAQAARNEVRKAQEDSIRGAYTATFATEASAGQMARRLSTDEAKTVKVLVESRGNHRNIVRMLENLPTWERNRALDALMAMSEKDRRDIPMEVVVERLSIPWQDNALYNDYVLNPRIEYEAQRPFVDEFLAGASALDLDGFRKNPRLWEKWVKDNVRIDNDWNPTNLRMDPIAVWKTRVADPRSRDIFFVASARAMGIPARIDQITGKTQWHDGRQWVDAMESAVATVDAGESTPKGKVVLTYEPEGRIPDPGYYSHFTISKIEDGAPRLLDFAEDATLDNLPDLHPSFDVGQYVLTTGQRMADGSVLARSTFFHVNEGATTEVPVVIRHDDQGIQVIGNFNSENPYKDEKGDVRTLLSTTGRGYYTLIYARPNHEPSSHVLNDIVAAAQKFESDGRKIMLLYGDENQLARAELAKRFPGLPKNLSAGSDIDGKIARELASNLHLDTDDHPIVIIADTFNRVVFLSQGYTIGIDSTLLSLLSQIQ